MAKRGVLFSNSEQPFPPFTVTHFFSHHPYRRPFSPKDSGSGIRESWYYKLGPKPASVGGSRCWRHCDLTHSRMASVHLPEIRACGGRWSEVHGACTAAPGPHPPRAPASGRAPLHLQHPRYPGGGRRSPAAGPQHAPRLARGANSKFAGAGASPPRAPWLAPSVRPQPPLLSQDPPAACGRENSVRCLPPPGSRPTSAPPGEPRSANRRSRAPLSTHRLEPQQPS